MKTSLDFNHKKLYKFLAEIVIPAMLVLSKVAPREQQYTILSFPPRRCEDKQSNFLSAILPKSAITFAATIMLVIIGWIIHKVSSILCNNTSNITEWYVANYLLKKLLHAQS